MIWLYRLLFFPLLLLLLPHFLWRMLKRGGYAATAAHRWGSMGTLPQKGSGKLRVWLHAVSVGEIHAAAALIDAFPKNSFEFVVTTTTSTGYQIAQQQLAEECLALRGFPLDFWCFSKRAWQSFQPDLAILMEEEVWPEHCHQARSKGVPLFLVNARLSDRSFGLYRRWFKAMGPLNRAWHGIDLILAASEEDRQRFLQLGISADRIQVSGNLKFDAALGQRLSSDEQRTLKTSLGFSPIPSFSSFSSE